MSNKKGRFSNQEYEFIISNVNKMTDEEIALAIQRDVVSVRNYVNHNNLRIKSILDMATDGEVELAVLLKSLRQKSYYQSIKKQLSEEELKYFEERWVETVKQFELNIKPTEEIQLKQAIILDIAIDRVQIEKQHNADEIERLNVLINEELRLPKESRDMYRIERLVEEINYCRGAIKDSMKTYRELITEYKNIQIQLKASRSQRMEKIEEGSKNWSNYLKLLDDEEFRRLANNDADAMRMAKHNARMKLYEFVEFDDGTVDLPILNSDSTALIEK